MTTPTYNQNELGETKESTSASMKESIRTRLPRADDNGSSIGSPPLAREPLPPTTSPEPGPGTRRLNFLPAFWTIASVLSMIVNVVLIIILLLLFQMRNRIPEFQGLAKDQATGLLGGLYTNFVKMDQANIRTNIHVEKDIPVQFSLNVSGPTNVTLSRPVEIRGARVTILTGALHIHGAEATILLPAGVVLPINIENLVVPVNQQVPAVLDVPVNIPLSQTELHEPFVGLRKVVEPWYCLIEPRATVDGLQVCARTADPALTNPTPESPTPVGTVIP